MTTEEINRRFCELAGICWHDYNGWINHIETLKCKYCAEKYKPNANPNFCAHPDLVLEVMRKREDWRLFLSYCTGYRASNREEIAAHWAELFLNKTGLLCRIAIKWMEENQC